MSQSLAKIYIHIVFSTKNREPWIGDKIRDELYPYMTTILKECESPVLAIGGISDHVHILCILSKNLAFCKLIEEVKKRTSKWIKTKDKQYAGFQWQAGYGVFSVSQSQVDIVQKYIHNQAEHHCKMTFMDELREFLKKYKIPFDEKYIWD